MSSPRAALAIVLMSACALLVGPGTALAQPSCGEVITQDTSLTEDLICTEAGTGVPAPDGGFEELALLIDADDVTLDLNGHRVITDLEGIGVYGRDNVIIRDGGAANITLQDTTDSRLINLTRRTGPGWVSLYGSHRNVIKASALGGIYLGNSDDNVVKDSSLVGEGGGVALDLGSDRNRVLRNTLCAGMGYPLFIDQANDNLIKHNIAPAGIPELGWSACSFLSEHGMLVTERGAGNRLLGNTVEGVPGDGIRVESPTTTLFGNTANFNGGYGIRAVPGVRAGGNYARGNANPLQCLNVRCVPRPGG